MFSKRVRFQEDQFSRDYENLIYSDDQVSKKDNKVRDDKYQPSESDDMMVTKPDPMLAARRQK
jgi:hypothetical protein